MINEASTLLSTIANLMAPPGELGSKETSTVSRAWVRTGRRGVTIACTPKESSTDKRHYIFIVAPGYGDFIQNMTTSALQADKTHIMVPADGSFTAAIDIGDHKAGGIQSQRLDSSFRLINH